MELSETHCPDFKINIDKNNTYMTCTQNWEVPVSYQRCYNKTGEACEKKWGVMVLGKVLLWNC